MDRITKPLPRPVRFLSSNTQDFIEVMMIVLRALIFDWEFLSSNTQDFIEVPCNATHTAASQVTIPEL